MHAISPPHGKNPAKKESTSPAKKAVYFSCQKGSISRLPKRQSIPWRRIRRKKEEAEEEAEEQQQQQQWKIPQMLFFETNFVHLLLNFKIWETLCVHILKLMYLKTKISSSTGFSMKLTSSTKARASNLIFFCMFCDSAHGLSHQWTWLLQYSVRHCGTFNLLLPNHHMKFLQEVQYLLDQWPCVSYSCRFLMS